MRIFFSLFILLTLAGPLWILFTNKIDFHADYRTANRESSGIAPRAQKTPDAVIQVYSARTFNWRGMFAVHTWIAVKAKNAQQYKVYQVIGWRLFMKLPPLSVADDLPDRFWFNEKPEIILNLQGDVAEQLIPKIAKAAEAYPYPNEYHYWPGPNSNTFTAFVARQVPELGLALPSIAIGKDFIEPPFLARAPSGTGYQISIYGIAGVMVAAREGVEINLFGLVYGFSPLMRTLKLPGFGDIKF